MCAAPSHEEVTKATADLLALHGQRMAAGNFPELLSEYGPDSVVYLSINHELTKFKGPQEVGAMFQKIGARMPPGKTERKRTNGEVHGNVVFLTWEAKTPTETFFGTDTFVRSGNTWGTTTINVKVDPIAAAE